MLLWREILSYKQNGWTGCATYWKLNANKNLFIGIDSYAKMESYRLQPHTVNPLKIQLIYQEKIFWESSMTSWNFIVCWIESILLELYTQPLEAKRLFKNIRYWMTVANICKTGCYGYVSSTYTVYYSIELFIRSFVLYFAQLIEKNQWIKMQRPNFQLIEDQPEKNYMRYVSQYKLDDMVTQKFIKTHFMPNEKIVELVFCTDGQNEAAELWGHTIKRDENETAGPILLFEFNESGRAVLHVYIAVCFLCTQNG